jgi:hypothetical protein
MYRCWADHSECFCARSWTIHVRDPRLLYGQGGQRNLSSYMPLAESGMAQDESGDAAAGGRRPCEQRFITVASLSRLWPRAAVWLTWPLVQALCRDTSSVSQVHPLARPRGNLGFPDDPSAQRRRGIAPKNIATSVTHTEALEPMAGTLWTSYDASFPRAEAMKKPSRARGKSRHSFTSSASC